MKKILVTGADGFIGSHLVEELVRKGFRVKAFVLYNSFNSWGWIDSFPDEIKNEIEIFSGDVRDPHGVEKALQDCNIVFHLAALIGIPYSYHSPDMYIDTNVKGTLNILQAAKKLNMERVLVTSTSEVYGTAQYVPIDERHPLQAQSPYSASKIGADKIAESFYRSFQLPITIVRPFNTFGPRQSLRAIIPTIIMQLLNGNNTIKLGNLKPKRDLLFVKDTVNGFIEIAKSEKTIGEVVNIATNTEISMGELVNKIIKKINQDAQVVTDNSRIRPEKSEVFRLIGDNSKIKKMTNWNLNYSLSESLDLTISWFKRNHQLYNKTNIYNI